MYRDGFLSDKLSAREAAHALRALRFNEGLIDFCSNDYLGLARSAMATVSAAESAYPKGSGGSRLLSGNYALIEETEALIASFHRAEAALIFNSGYDANLGLLSAVVQREDTIFYDQLSHASIRDGIVLSRAKAFSFLHNDPGDLAKKMAQATGNVFVVTESLFSMDGDIPPLKDIANLCTQHGAHLIVDEAHATGVLGPSGAGLVQELQLMEQVFARIHTFGKAVGAHGAVVLGSRRLRDYLINFSRSFMYTTALPPAAVAVIAEHYRIFPQMEAARQMLRQLSELFQSSRLAYSKLVSASPIQAVVVPGNSEVRTLAQHIQEAGIDVRPILYPTVPKGAERLRIVLHAYNTKEELNRLISLLQ